MSIDWPLLWLLLPVAAFSGYWLGRRAPDSKNGAGALFHPDYFRGLNFVLNEQPDKAIEVFIRMLEVDSETVETHLALGNLFRRRGEVDRAIRIHQNLIARPKLNREQRAAALLELGMDYMRSGLLDRAEGLFLELAGSNLHLGPAYTELLAIYQQEQDWDKAIGTARRLAAVSGHSQDKIIGQFYCEQAELAAAAGNQKAVRDFIRRALSFDPDCVRASLIEAQMHLSLGGEKAAIRAYKRVEAQNSAYLGEIIAPLRECYRRLDRLPEFARYLRALVGRYGGIRALLTMTELIAERDGENAAVRFISAELKGRPNVKGVHRLIEYTLATAGGETREHLQTIRELTAQLSENRAVYQCGHCGFSGKALHWQCPGCQRWETIKPICGVAGE